ncbi:hypothetical protein BD289DRAFT_430231 [Coniella lustricola]|uniref:Uncharacterized protein n=1 Tax=Coniella lustricola TaxID=2025994 RepID=A0A2T3AC51_9PEZI|nr:hypothetical protein BD289DRAFT_430231 [Coniella lustricola]
MIKTQKEQRNENPPEKITSPRNRQIQKQQQERKSHPRLQKTFPPPSAHDRGDGVGTRQ